MKRIVLSAVALGFVPFAALADDAATPEQIAQIDEVLEAKECEVDPANIEVEDGVFDLDDVMCASGQYDMKLDASYAVTEERKE